MTPTFTRSACYEPRPTRFLGVREYQGGWCLKTYSIVRPGATLDAPAYEEALTLASRALPQPAQSSRRPGVGFVIAHQGGGGEGERERGVGVNEGVLYLVLGWWDNENELPLRVWVREDAERRWRAALEHESVCVWDLRVLWHERNAYVRHVLGPDAEPDVGAYLADALRDQER